MAITPKCGPASPIICPPTVVNRDIFIPQPVQVVHPIEIVNRYHCVPVYQHITTVTCRDATAAVSSRRRKRK